MGKTGTTLWAQVKGVKGTDQARPEERRRGKDPGTEPAVQGRRKCQADRPDGRGHGRARRFTRRQRRTWRQARRRPFRWLRDERVHGKPDDPQAHAQGKSLRARCKGKVLTLIYQVGRTNARTGLRGSPDPLFFFTHRCNRFLD